MHNITTFKDLTRVFVSSPHYKSLSSSTKYTYGKIINSLISVASDYPLEYQIGDKLPIEVANYWNDKITASGANTAYTKNYQKTVLGLVFRWGTTNLGITPSSNPSLYLPKYKHESEHFKPFTYMDMQKIKARMAVTGYTALKKKDLLTAYLVQFLFETGMRPSEMMNIREHDVVLESREEGFRPDRYLQIVGAKGREEGKISRYVFISPVSSKIIQWFIEHRRSTKAASKHSFLFTTVQGRKIKAQNLHARFTILMDLVGIEGKQLYDARRGCATEIINNPELGINVAMKQLGHKDIATTQKYERLDKIRAASMFKGHRR